MGVLLRKDLLELFKTVCAAGQARAAFDSEAQEGLEELRNAGLLEVDRAPGARLKHFTPGYRPTAAGCALWRKLSKDAA